MHLPGDELKILALKNSVREVGDYENFVMIKALTVSGNRVFSYKIDTNLPGSIIKKISSCIENKAKKSGFEILRFF